MQFLDVTGLAYFWEKIKDWANSLFFSKRGGEISPESGLHYIINGEQLDVSVSSNENETISIFNVDENGISVKSIVRTGGDATQVLMADGSLKTLGINDGIATLDSMGNVPLQQLGNLDTTVAEVVTSLPKANIKKHIYLIKDTSGVTQNQYEEYIYTGNTSETYDASKWEKLGDFRATVDLANYAKKSEIPTKVSQLSNDKGYLTSHQSLADYAKKSETVDISTIKVEEEVLDVAPQGQKLQQVIYFPNFNGKIKKVVIKDATSNMSGFMSIRDKNRLDGIASGATADSAITTAEIDALFA